jgi:hypothetical protein
LFAHQSQIFSQIRPSLQWQEPPKVKDQQRNAGSIDRTQIVDLEVLPDADAPQEAVASPPGPSTITLVTGEVT